MSQLRRAVFLDRDGVINAAVVRDNKPYPPNNIEEFKIIAGVKEGLQRLHEQGFLLVVATNQPDVGRGTMTQTAVEKIHNYMCQELPIDRVEVCYDDGRTVDTEFRKPKPGMLLQAAKVLGIDLQKSYMIGDRWRDVDAGANAGCHTIFIDYGYDEKLRSPPNRIVKSITEAVGHILLQENRKDLR